LSVKPLNGYHVNISHSEIDGKKLNELSVKGLHHDNTREYVDENSEEDDEDYVDYEDDYGVILNEEDRALKETSTSKAEVLTTPATTTTTTTTTTSTFSPTTFKQEDQTVIIFDNFILPKSTSDSKEEELKNDEEVEYEYEYEDETEEPEVVKTTEKPVTTKMPEYDVEITTYRDPKRILGEAVVSVVTSKTVVNGTVSEMRDERVETTTEPENYPSIPIKSTTDNYVVVASVQTSRSVSGAHFLPFPHVEQKERKQSRAELVSKKLLKEESVTDLPEVRTTQISETENVSAEIEDDDEQFNDYTTSVSFYEEPSTTVATTVKNSPVPSTESIIDKLDGIQSDLSLGVLSGEFPVLKDASSSKKSKGSTTEAPEPIEISTTVKPIVLIRKFMPKSTSTKAPVPKPTTKATTTTTSTTENIPTTTTAATTESSQRANKKITFDNIPQDDVLGLLPPGFKPRSSYKNKKIQTATTTTQVPSVKDEVKTRNATIGRSFKSQPAGQELNSKFKNKDKFKSTSENDTDSSSKKTYSKLFEASNDEIDISKFLPPDFKEKNKNDSLAVIPLEHDELSKFLPPGFKIGTTTTALPKVKVIEDDLKKFLPPGYKAPDDEEKDEKVVDSLSGILSKIKFQEPANLLPPGFKEDSASTVGATVDETTSKPTNKLVFPTRAGKKPSRVTTTESPHGKGPKPPEIKIMKGPPTRATTEFTGWPSKPTTPISIERLLELQKNAGAIEINISDILSKTTEESTTTTSTTPSTTTTTTTTTQRPESATICKNEVCSLAATIRIIEGVEWSPELLTHHTDEYKKLARELEASLNEVYTNSPSLKQYFRNIRIDSFSKGSVLVDYFIEFSDIPNNGLKTSEVKRMFHESLTPVSQFNSTINEDEGLPQPIVKEAFKLGNFVVDPISTDFIGENQILIKLIELISDFLLLF
jgi:SEA domain